MHPPLGGGLPPIPRCRMSAAVPTERAANVSDREREKDEPAPSKWHRLKASLFGQKPTPPAEALTPAPEPAKDTAAAAHIPSPPPELPAEKAEGSGKKKSKSGSQKRQRGRKIFVVVDEAERLAICYRAQAAGLSTSAYGRACMLGNKGPRAKRVPPVNHVMIAEAIGALNRVGNNINQLARHANQGQTVEAALLKPALEAYAEALKTLLEACGK